MTQEQQVADNAVDSPVFSIDKIYVKDLSIEVPNAPQIFLERETPGIDIELHSTANNIGEGYYEVVLTVTVTAKLEEKVVFLVQVGQAGIFQIRNVPEEALNPLLSIAAPTALFPYAREAVSDATTRCGFPPVVLTPVNFEAMYMAQQQEAAAAAAATQQ
jgi:preprotein translocase subunit SecB